MLLLLMRLFYVPRFYNGTLGQEYYDYDLCALTPVAVSLTFSIGMLFTLYAPWQYRFGPGSMRITP